MSRLVDLFVRLVVIMAGYVVAILAASAFLHLVAWPVLFGPEEQLAILFGGMFLSVPFVAAFVGYFAFIPFVIVAGLAEILGYRSWVYYTLAGGLAGFVIAGVFRIYGAPQSFDTVAETAPQVPLVMMPEAMLAVIGGGIVGGFAYWLVAGRSAGLWLDRYPRVGDVSGPGRSGS